MQGRGIPVVDIRPEPDFKKGRIPGSINVQLYQLIAGEQRGCQGAWGESPLEG